MAQDVGQYRLLAVDDNDDCSELIVRTAVKCGYEAFPLSNARSLRETISRWRPQVITLDLCLPEVDGFEILSLLRTIQFGGHLIIISAQSESLRDQALILASNHGLRVLTHMSKPIHLGQLRELLTTIKESLPQSDLNQFDPAASQPAEKPYQ